MTRKIKPLIHLEQLEPRIMLSGDGLLNIAPDPDQDAVLENPSEVVQEAELVQINGEVEEQINQELAQPSTPNTDICQPIFFTLSVDDNKTNGKLVDADLNVDNIGPAQTDEIALLSFDSNVETESNVGITEDESMPTCVSDADLSIEYATSIEIRGPPAGEIVTFQDMYLVDPTVNYFDGQIVYLNFDGVENVTYNGTVVVEGIDILMEIRLSGVAKRLIWEMSVKNSRLWEFTVGFQAYRCI